MARRLEGRRVLVSFPMGAGRPRFEDQHKVVKLVRWRPGEGRDGRGIVTFIAVRGGTRTLDVADIADVR